MIQRASFNVASLMAIASGAIFVAAVGCSDDTSTAGTATGTGTATGSGTATGTSTGSEGGGGSGSATCASYCALIAATCDDPATELQYDGAMPEESCLGTCATWEAGTPGDTTGDTLECRVSMVEAAATAQPELNCPQGGPFGGATCGTSQCAAFCAVQQEVCGTAQYDDAGDCETDCNNFAGDEDAFVNDNMDVTDSFLCRGYHLTVAAISATSAMTHCQHTGGPNSKTGESMVCTM